MHFFSIWLHWKQKLITKYKQILPTVLTLLYKQIKKCPILLLKLVYCNNNSKLGVLLPYLIGDFLSPNHRTDTHSFGLPLFWEHGNAWNLGYIKYSNIIEHFRSQWSEWGAFQARRTSMTCTQMYSMLWMWMTLVISWVRGNWRSRKWTSYYTKEGKDRLDGHWNVYADMVLMLKYSALNLGGDVQPDLEFMHSNVQGLSSCSTYCR
jgi:hypothetical protein